ncbi:MAG TPA: hypothetical protein VGC84_08455 [Ilumatobacteraceae bacterium]
MNDDPDVHLLMSAQHGVAATTQVRRGLTWRDQTMMIGAGAWRRDNDRVVTSRSAPVTWHQRVMVATLTTRGVASHTTAARLHRLDGFSRADAVHVLLRYNQRRSKADGARVHLSRVFAETDQLIVDGIPTVILPVCLIQLADGAHDDMIRALEGTMRDGINPTWIRQVAARYDRPGLPAARRVVRALDQRVDGTVARSWFQRLASRVLSNAGLQMVDEYPVHQGARLLAQLDLALPDLLVGVECQSWQWHSTPDAQRRDAERRRKLRRLGWEIVDVWWSDLDGMDGVLATLAVIIADRTRAVA